MRLLLFIDYRNKLAIHAKRVTVTEKDFKLLRDLWFTIEPNNHIAKRSDESKQAEAHGKRRELGRLHRYKQKHYKILRSCMLRRDVIPWKTIRLLDGWDLISKRFAPPHTVWTIGAMNGHVKYTGLPYSGPLPPQWATRPVTEMLLDDVSEQDWLGEGHGIHC